MFSLEVLIVSNWRPRTVTHGTQYWGLNVAQPLGCDSAGGDCATQG